MPDVFIIGNYAGSDSGVRRVQSRASPISSGASASNVVGLVVRHGLALTGTGLAIGLAASWAATRALKTALYGVTVTDPATFASVAALLTLVALSACLIPARRASNLDPIVVLREE